MKKNALVVVILLLSQILLAQTETDFYDIKSIREIKLSFKEKNWSEILDSLKLNGEGMLLGAVEIDGRKYEQVGISYRGDKSFQVAGQRNPFSIKLNYKIKTQAHAGYSYLKLSNALRDPSLVREVLSYEIARKYMPAPKANYAKLSINGEYRGLYVNAQPIDEVFLKQNFGETTGDLVKCSPPDKPIEVKDANCKKGIFSALEAEENLACYALNYQAKSENGLAKVQTLTQSLGKGGEELSKQLNIDRTIWMLVFNNVLVNLNSYSGDNSQNYYLYADSTGQFNPILWDMNLSFGSYKNALLGKSSLTLSELQQLDPYLHQNNALKPLISQILKNAQFKKVYNAHLRTLLYDNFLNGWYEKRAKELQQLINNALVNDKYKLYSQQDFLASLNKTIGSKTKIPGIVELMEKRGKFLKKHPAIQALPSEVTKVTLASRQKFEHDPINSFKIKAVVANYPQKVRIYYRFASNLPYTVANMHDDGKNQDDKAADGVFGIEIPSEQRNNLQYYIVTENVAAVQFYPAQYMFEPLKADLKELNK